MNRPLKTLESICIDKGLQTGPFGSQLKADEYSHEGVPVVMPRDIVNGQITTHAISRVPESKAFSLSKHRLKEGDIVFSRRGDLNKIAVVSWAEKGFLCGTGCLRARPISMVNSDYLRYCLLTKRVSVWLLKHAVGQTMLNLNTGIISSLPLHLPERDEQDKITEILLNWDHAINLTEKLIAEKQQLRKGLMQQLLTGKRRLPGFDKSKEVQSTRWGNYPADWDYQRIEKIAKHVSCKNKKRKTLPVLSCTKHRGLVDSLEYFGKQVFSKNLSTYKIVQRGQFAYATNHIEEGSIGYQDIYDTAVISPMYTVFETEKKIDDHFLYLLFKTELYRHIFEINTNSSVNRRGSLRWPAFSRIHVPIPNIKEQQAIVKIANMADQELKLLQAKADALREQKKGLMQQLLTGKKRVKVRS